jgi:hypothetical protein
VQSLENKNEMLWEFMIQYGVEEGLGRRWKAIDKGRGRFCEK